MRFGTDLLLFRKLDHDPRREAPMTVHDANCPLDCPDACSLTVTVEDGRVTTVDGTEANPVTRGFICSKVRRLPEALYGPDRVLAPLVREGAKGAGSFREAGWGEALDRVAGELRRVRDESGGEAILPLSYGGSNGILSQDTTDARLFHRLGASRLARTVCAAPTAAAVQGLYGKMVGTAYPDYEEARLIVVWGMNPHVSGIHLVPCIQEAQKRGAKLVVVDPRRTKLARRADLHLAPRPGTDLPLALAVIRILFEEGGADRDFLARHATGAETLRERASMWNLPRAAHTCQVDAPAIETFARWYAEISPAVLRCGWGLERNRNGGSAAAAVLALPAVAGKFGVRGGGYTMSSSSVWKLAAAGSNAPPPGTRIVNMNRVGRVLTGGEPPVRALFVYNCNPLVTLPQQTAVRRGLEREDLFTVVFDSFLTDTARYADVVLPAATFLERREVSRGYGALVLHDGRPAAPPVGESRTNHEVFLELCDRLELSRPDDPRTEDEVLAAILRATPHGDRLARDLAGRGRTVPECGDRPVQFVDVFPGTGDGKVHLCPGDLDREAPLGLYAYRPDPATDRHPLVLISPATDRTISSTLGQLVPGKVPLDMHPLDATPRGIRDGDPVRVVNDLGEVRCRARINPEVRAGVVNLPKGLWERHTESGTTSNALCPDTLTDLAGGACFNDARVQVEKIQGA